MELFEAICYVLTGLGVFLLGMKLMGDGLKQSAGRGMKALFNNLNDRKVVSFGIGLGATAVVQASGATTVLSMGLINAGLMSLPIGLAVCLGAKVGTTVTGLLASLSSLPISAALCVIALIGTCFILFAKRDIMVQIGYIIAGLGTLFAGMYLMKSSIGSNALIMDGIKTAFSVIDYPLLLALIGVVVTVLVQSSSTVSVILIALIGANAITFEAGMFILIGASIGTCSTGLLASVGSTKDAVRLAVLNTLCSVVTAIVYGILIGLLNAFIIMDGVGVISYVFGLIGDPTWSLSLFGLSYNLIAAVSMLPFVGLFAKLGKYIIPDGASGDEALRTYYIDEKFFKTPVIAVVQVKKEVLNLGQLASANLMRGLHSLIDEDYSEKDEIYRAEDKIDHITREIASYLVKLASLELTYSDERFVGTLHHVIDDIERIGDHAYTFFRQAEKMNEEGYHFSKEAVEEISTLRDKISKMSEATYLVFQNNDFRGLGEISDMEDEIDRLKKEYGNNHIKRLNGGGCDVETGTYFYSAVEALERVADHLVNVAFSIQSITGSQKA